MFQSFQINGKQTHIINVIIYSILVELSMIVDHKTLPIHTHFLTVHMYDDLIMEQQDYPPHINNH